MKVPDIMDVGIAEDWETYHCRLVDEDHKVYFGGPLVWYKKMLKWVADSLSHEMIHFILERDFGSVVSYQYDDTGCYEWDYPS